MHSLKEDNNEHSMKIILVQMRVIHILQHDLMQMDLLIWIIRIMDLKWINGQQFALLRLLMERMYDIEDVQAEIDFLKNKIYIFQ